jgi:hypothetical protein
MGALISDLRKLDAKDTNPPMGNYAGLDTTKPWIPPPPPKFAGFSHANLGGQKSVTPFESSGLLTADNISNIHF